VFVTIYICTSNLLLTIGCFVSFYWERIPEKLLLQSNLSVINFFFVCRMCWSHFFPAIGSLAGYARSVGWNRVEVGRVSCYQSSPHWAPVTTCEKCEHLFCRISQCVSVCISSNRHGSSGKTMSLRICRSELGDCFVATGFPNIFSVENYRPSKWSANL